MVKTFTVATGWLGWPPDMVLDTPIVQVEMAIEGKMDFLRKTNPWRTKEDVEAEKIEERAKENPDPDSMVAFFQSLRAIAKPLPPRRMNGISQTQPTEASDG